MSNSPQMHQQLSKRCDHSHEHQPLVGGRCADAAFYPLPLVRAILNGIEDTTKAMQHARMEAVESGMHAAAVICASRTQVPVEKGVDEDVVLGKTEMQTTRLSSRMTISKPSTTMNTRASHCRTNWSARP